jgi:hypothetical protein
MARIFIWQAIVRQRLYFYTASLFIICHVPSLSFAAPAPAFAGISMTAAAKDSVLPVRPTFNLSSGNNQINAELIKRSALPSSTIPSPQRQDSSPDGTDCL